MERAKQYHAKLVNIKKEMCSLHARTAQLKVCSHSSMITQTLMAVSEENFGDF